MIFTRTLEKYRATRPCYFAGSVNLRHCFADNRNMKRFLFLLCALQALLSAVSAADYNDETVLEIRGVGVPYEKDDTVVFTADAKSRFTGIAFDFEGYKTIHPFRIHTMRDMDGKAKGSVLFYILRRPEAVRSLSYRLVIDGL